MLNSNERKLSLSGWLQEHKVSAYCSRLRLQCFLFLYEAFSKISNDRADFSCLKGYKRGPVISSVWTDYINERVEFDRSSLDKYHKLKNKINDLRAQRAAFIVSSLSENELSALTHKFNIWNAKKDRIMAGESEVDLYESDFIESDYEISKALEAMFPNDMIQNSDIIEVSGKYFVLSKKYFQSLKEQHIDVLASLSELMTCKILFIWKSMKRGDCALIKRGDVLRINMSSDSFSQIERSNWIK